MFSCRLYIGMEMLESIKLFYFRPRAGRGNQSAERHHAARKAGLHDVTQEGLFLEAPNRLPVGSVAVVVVRRVDVAKVVEVKVVRIATNRSN